MCITFLKENKVTSVAIQKLVWAVNGWENDIAIEGPVLAVYNFEVMLRVLLQLVKTNMETRIQSLRTQFYPQPDASGPENLRIFVKLARRQQAKLSDLWQIIGNNIFENEQV